MLARCWSAEEYHQRCFFAELLCLASFLSVYCKQCCLQSLLRMFSRHTHTHIYIYIYAVKLKSGPRFGGFKVKKWSKFKVKKWSKFFFFIVFPIFIVFLGIFRNTNSATVCQNSVFAQFGGCQKWGFRKENCIFCFFLFYVGKIETEKRKTKKMEKGQKTL